MKKFFLVGILIFFVLIGSGCSSTPEFQGKEIVAYNNKIETQNVKANIEEKDLNIIDEQKIDDISEIENIDKNEVKIEIEENHKEIINIEEKHENIQKEEFFLVTKVVDGDTIDVNINGKVERLRLIGINTPETVDPRKSVECFGIEASNKAKELLYNKKVRLENDITQSERDIYDRLLRYVFLEDGTMFNKWMVENGYAYEYTYNIPYNYQTEFKLAENYAKDNKLGLWGDYVCDDSVIDEVKNLNNEENSSDITVEHVFYTSSYYSSKTYYCDTDLAWKSLSEKYLKSYNNETELLKIYPTKVLHEPCK